MKPLLLSPLLLASACGQLATYCEHAPCPNFSPSGEVQPQPALIGPPQTVRRGQVLTLAVHIDLRGLPGSTSLAWLPADGSTGRALLDVPRRLKVVAAANPFTGDSTPTFSIAGDAPLGDLNDGRYNLALHKVTS